MKPGIQANLSKSAKVSGYLINPDAYPVNQCGMLTAPKPDSVALFLAAHTRSALDQQWP